jgi:branched-chain amino acid transport system permease protein
LHDALQQVANGLSLGAVFALIAVAYSMVYGIARLVNFAFGGFFMLGAYITAFLLGGSLPVFNRFHQGPAVGVGGAIAAAMLISGGLGWLMERAAYRPLRQRGTPIASLITSLGVLLLLQGLASLVFGPQPLPFPGKSLLRPAPVHLGSVIVLRPDMVILGAALILAVWLGIVGKRTLFGLQSRASAQDLSAAELQGVDTNQVIALTMVVGCMLAAVAGVFWAARFNDVEPTMGFDPGLSGLVAAVLGGIGSVLGAFVGGLLIGVVRSLGVAYIPGASAFGDGFTFAVMIILLWARPQGLLGTRGLARPGSIERPLPVFSRSELRLLLVRAATVCTALVVRR